MVLLSVTSICGSRVTDVSTISSAEHVIVFSWCDQFEGELHH